MEKVTIRNLEKMKHKGRRNASRQGFLPNGIKVGPPMKTVF